MLFWVKAVGFENTAQFQGSEIPPRLFQYVMVFVSGITQGELGGRGSPRFPCVTLVVESFSSDLPRAIVSYWAESHLESCEAFTKELFRENSKRPQYVDYFRKEKTWVTLVQLFINGTFDNSNIFSFFMGVQITVVQLYIKKKF